MSGILLNGVIMNHRLVVRGRKVNHECVIEPIPACRHFAVEHYVSVN